MAVVRNCQRDQAIVDDEVRDERIVLRRRSRAPVSSSDAGSTTAPDPAPYH